MYFRSHGAMPAAVLTDPLVMPQAAGRIDDRIPQVKLLCVFRRDPGKSCPGADHVPGDRSGRVALPVMIDNA